MTVGVNVKRHTRGWSGSWGMPPHRNEVDWVPISGGGEPSSVPTAKRAPAHEAPASRAAAKAAITVSQKRRDRKSTRLNSSHLVISYAVFCLKKKKKKRPRQLPHRDQQQLSTQPQ